jgi:hypothetical protein
MSGFEMNLERYLEAERLLNRFFVSLDYCFPNCIQKKMRENGNRPTAACCTQKYHSSDDVNHPAFDRLRQERKSLFGAPENLVRNNPVSPCEYHNPERGCMLSTHKSPICIAYLCPAGIELLRAHYGIFGYDYLGVYYALEWILTGELSDKAYMEFRNSITEMTGKIVQMRSVRR